MLRVHLIVHVDLETNLHLVTGHVVRFPCEEVTLKVFWACEGLARYQLPIKEYQFAHLVT